MLSQTCETLKGVGSILAAKLKKCKIHTLNDLLLNLPFRYQDKTHITPIRDLRPKEYAVIAGQVCKTEIKFGKRRMLYCYVDDNTAMLRLRFFHFNNAQLQALSSCKIIRAFGEINVFSNQLEIIHPEYALFSENEPLTVDTTLTPIYPSTEGLSQYKLRHLINQVLQTHQPELHALEWLTAEQLNTLKFISIEQSLNLLHNPPPEVSLESLELGSHPAIKRLAFDELLGARLRLQFAKQSRAALSAPSFKQNKALETAFLKQLPFSCTKAQQRVLQEIYTDLAQSKPMLRLVQGDVGCGKTVVATLALLPAIAAGYQTALMAPTDLLSEQHFNNLNQWLTPLGIHVARLSGKIKTKERRETLENVRTGVCQVLIGTHALFQEQVEFKQLGFIVIDEQHRFGVEQRLLLQQKSQHLQFTPHQLLMTATPIPRSLAMTKFSHVDISIIDELPPGRTVIKTAVVNQQFRETVIERLDAAIREKKQAYWVCSLIEESDKIQCTAATETALLLQQQLPNARVGLIHGRMKAVDKDTVMQQFKAHELDLLVATTVIEVGVDVPNASLMIIENAERLGLAQLHQLRGRVGRGDKESYCLLLYQNPLSQIGKERLHTLRSTNDGFVIAEKDLEIRGSGELLGTRQTGYQIFKIANLFRDSDLLPEVTRVSKELLAHSPELAKLIADRWQYNAEQFLQS